VGREHGSQHCSAAGGGSAPMRRNSWILNKADAGARLAHHSPRIDPSHHHTTTTTTRPATALQRPETSAPFACTLLSTPPQDKTTASLPARLFRHLQSRHPTSGQLPVDCLFGGCHRCPPRLIARTYPLAGKLDFSATLLLSRPVRCLFVLCFIDPCERRRNCPAVTAFQRPPLPIGKCGPESRPPPPPPPPPTRPVTNMDDPGIARLPGTPIPINHQQKRVARGI